MNTRSPGRMRAAFTAAALIMASWAAHAAPPQSMATTQAVPQNPGGAAPTADILDIRGPKPIASRWLIPLVAATTLLAVGGAYAAWAWNRRRFREASKRPLDIALERLEKARQLMAPPRGREFSIEVSSAVRDYIESRFGLRAAHLTTHEFLHQLLEQAESPLSVHRSQLDNFLQTCDLAKFGGWSLAAAEMEAMLQSAHRFIVDSAVDVGARGIQPAATIPADRVPTSASRETYVSLSST